MNTPPMTAAQRKRKQRERERKLDMKPFTMELAKGERAIIEEMANARGFEDQTEYVFSLVLKDWRDMSHK